MDYEEISTETKRLNKPDWLKIITRLHNNFKGYPFDAESQEPLNAIGAVLKTLKPNKILDEQFKSRLSQLDCFSYRSYYIDTKANQAIFWNPLKTPFVKFKNKQTTEYQAANEYPAPDIIRMWIHLKARSSSTD